MTTDFRAKQIQTNRLIASGGITGGGLSANNQLGLAIYSGTKASNLEGGVSDSNMFAGVGSDVFLFISGNKGERHNIGSANSITLFGGDMVVSGTFYAEKMVVEVDEVTTGSLWVSGSLVVSRSADIYEGLTVNSSKEGDPENNFRVLSQGKTHAIFVDAGADKVLILSGGDTSSPDETTYPDIGFFVSGTIGSRDSSIKGTSLFGGDLAVSGNVAIGLLHDFSATEYPFQIHGDGSNAHLFISSSIGSSNSVTAIIDGKNPQLQLKNSEMPPSAASFPTIRLASDESATSYGDLYHVTVGSDPGILGLANQSPGGVIGITQKNTDGTYTNAIAISGSDTEANSSIHIMSGTNSSEDSPNSTSFLDTNFFVSGTIGSKDTSNRGTAVFGGDALISGTAYVGALSTTPSGATLSLTASMVDIGWDPLDTSAGLPGPILRLSTHHESIVDTDTLGSVEFWGGDTDGMQVGAKIIAESAGTWNSGPDDAPSEIQFWTTNNGTSEGIRERMVISKDGTVGLNIAPAHGAPGASLHVSGATEVTTTVLIDGPRTADYGAQLRLRTYGGFSEMDHITSNYSAYSGSDSPYYSLFRNGDTGDDTFSGVIFDTKKTRLIGMSTVYDDVDVHHTYWDNETARYRPFVSHHSGTTGPFVMLLSGTVSAPEDQNNPRTYTDTNFWVSGSIDAKNSSTRGTAVFGGDTHVSGGLTIGPSNNGTLTVFERGGSVRINNQGGNASELEYWSWSEGHLTMKGHSDVFGPPGSEKGAIGIGFPSGLTKEEYQGFLHVSGTSADVDTLYIRHDTGGLWSSSSVMCVGSGSGREANLLNIYVSGSSSQFLVLSGGHSSSPNEIDYGDTNFFVSGTVGSRNTSTRGTSVFGGDVVVSGTLYAEKMVVEVDEVTTGSLLVSGSLVVSQSANIHEGLTVNSSQEGGNENDFTVSTSGKPFAIFADASSNKVLILSGGDPSSIENVVAIPDVNFYVSGSVGSKGTDTDGTSLFGGDVAISGTAYIGGLSTLPYGKTLQVTASMVDIGWDPGDPSSDVSPTLRLTTHNNAVGTNDTLGSIEFFGVDTDSAAIGAKIVGEAAGTWNLGPSDHPSEIQFWTTDNGTASPIAQRMVIDKIGQVGINVDAPSDMLHVSSSFETTTTVKVDGPFSKNYGAQLSLGAYGGASFNDRVYTKITAMSGSSNTWYSKLRNEPDNTFSGILFDSSKPKFDGGFLFDSIDVHHTYWDTSISGYKPFVSHHSGSTGPLVLFMSGTSDSTTSPSPREYTDTNFWVSGSIDSRDSSTRGTAVFGGDVVTSGNLRTPLYAENKWTSDQGEPSATGQGAIAMGAGSVSSGYGTTVGGGFQNTATNSYATVAGGGRNLASNNYAAIGGGLYNTASSYYTTVPGGLYNVASALYASIGGGTNNKAAHYGVSIGGGAYNTGTLAYSTVAGGYCNWAYASYSSVGGGYHNTGSGTSSVVPGGLYNVASGHYSAVLGSSGSTASGQGSFAIGTEITASQANTVHIGGGGPSVTDYHTVISSSLFKVGGGFATDGGDIYGTDTNFFVSGTVGSRDTQTRGTSVFGGDVVISGTLFGGSPLVIGSPITANSTLDVNYDEIDGSSIGFQVHTGSTRLSRHLQLLPTLGDPNWAEIQVVSCREIGTGSQITLESGESGVYVNLGLGALSGTVNPEYRVLRNEVLGTDPAASFTGIITNGAIAHGDRDAGSDSQTQPFHLLYNDFASDLVKRPYLTVLSSSTGPQIFLLSGTLDAPTSIDARNFDDTNFFVSGTIGSKNTSTRGTSVFGGDVVVSGSLALNQGAVAGSQVFVTTQGRVGIGTDAPDYKLDVAGSIGANEYIYHNGDSDTFIRFQDDDISIQVGGVDAIKITEDGSNSEVLILSGGGSSSPDPAAFGDTVFFVSGGIDKKGVEGVAVFGGDTVTSGAMYLEQLVGQPREPDAYTGALYSSGSSGGGTTELYFRNSDGTTQITGGGGSSYWTENGSFLYPSTDGERSILLGNTTDSTADIVLFQGGGASFNTMGSGSYDADFKVFTTASDNGYTNSAIHVIAEKGNPAGVTPGMVMILSGGDEGSPDPTNLGDTNFYVSGTAGAKHLGTSIATENRGVAVFGGDVVASGSLFVRVPADDIIDPGTVFYVSGTATDISTTPAWSLANAGTSRISGDLVISGAIRGTNSSMAGNDPSADDLILYSSTTYHFANSHSFYGQNSIPENTGMDVSFFASGSKGTKGIAGQTVFGGDTVASGSVESQGFFMTPQTISSDQFIPANYNAVYYGPEVTVDGTIEIGSNSVLTIMS